MCLRKKEIKLVGRARNQLGNRNHTRVTRVGKPITNEMNASLGTQLVMLAKEKDILPEFAKVDCKYWKMKNMMKMNWKSQ